MDQVRYPRTALAAFVCAATLTTGCGAPSLTVPAAPSGTPVSTISTPASAAVPPARTTAAKGGHGGRGGSNTGSSAAAGALPADWPPDLPIPQGNISGSTGSAGRWTVLIVAAGSAPDVRQSAVALYSAAGFTPVSDSVLNKGNRQITLVVENRDHSATQTTLVVGVTTR